jgi:hypothetical protein
MNRRQLRSFRQSINPPRVSGDPPEAITPLLTEYPARNPAPTPEHQSKGAFYNPLQFTVTMHSETVGQSFQALGQNTKRQFLQIQNQSTNASVFVGFGIDAGLNQGLEVAFGLSATFNIAVPNSAIYLYLSGDTSFPVCILEGRPMDTRED